MRIKTKKWLSRAVLMLMLITTLLGGFSSSVYATEEPDTSTEEDVDEEEEEPEETSDEDSDLSLYKAASTASGFYDITHNKSKDNEKYRERADDFKGVPMAVAGAFVGYYDYDLTDFLFRGATVSDVTYAAQSRGYAAYPEKGMKEYLQYGNALRQLGLDSTGYDALDASKMGRAMSGSLMYFAYRGATVVDGIFSVVVNILRTLNPFTLFVPKGGHESRVWLNILQRKAGPVNPALAGLRNIVSSVYSTLSNLSWFVIPVMFAFLVFSLLIWNGSAYQSGDSNLTKFRKYVTRVTYIVIGIPLLGLFYTGALDMLGENVGVNSGGLNANHIVASTFVDFESWAANTHLSLPNDVQIVVNTNQLPSGIVDMGSTTNVRKLARRINATSGAGDWGLFTGPASTVAGDDTAGWNEAAFEDATAPSSKATDIILDMLDRYRQASFYNASDFETEVKGSIDEKEARDEDLIALTAKKTYEKASSDELISGTVGGVTHFLGDYASGRIVANKSGDKTTFTGNTSITFNSRGEYRPQYYGLSTLGMFNYLATTFEPGSVTTFSSYKVTSAAVRHSHRSVNLVGTGLTSGLYYLHALSMLCVILVIGVVYGLGMIINNIRRTLNLLTSIPFSMMGHLQSMARVVGIVFMMITEIIGTLFLYILTLEIFRVLGSIVEVPMVQAMSDLFNGFTGGGPGVEPPPVPGGILPIGNFHIGALDTGATVVVLLIGIVLNFWFLRMALKLRKEILRTIDEWIAGVIDRVFMAKGGASGAVGQDHMPEKKRPGFVRSAAGGLAAGAGVAAAQRVMNGDKKGKDGKNVKGTVEGEDGREGKDKEDGKDGKDSKDPTSREANRVEGFERQALPAGDEEDEDGESSKDDDDAKKRRAASGNPYGTGGGFDDKGRQKDTKALGAIRSDDSDDDFNDDDPKGPNSDDDDPNGPDPNNDDPNNDDDNDDHDHNDDDEGGSGVKGPHGDKEPPGGVGGSAVPLMPDHERKVKKSPKKPQVAGYDKKGRALDDNGNIIRDEQGKALTKKDVQGQQKNAQPIDHNAVKGAATVGAGAAGAAAVGATASQGAKGQAKGAQATRSQRMVGEDGVSLVEDPETGLLVDPETGQTYDARSGKPRYSRPVKGQSLNRNRGVKPISPASGMRVDQDGRPVYTDTDGNSFVEMPDGTRRAVDLADTTKIGSDGKPMGAGGAATKTPQARSVKTNSGYEIATDQSGGSTVTTKDGMKHVTSGDGSLSTYDKNGNLIYQKGADGSEYIANSYQAELNGEPNAERMSGGVKRTADGKMVLVDSNGREAELTGVAAEDAMNRTIDAGKGATMVANSTMVDAMSDLQEDAMAETDAPSWKRRAMAGAVGAATANTVNRAFGNEANANAAYYTMAAMQGQDGKQQEIPKIQSNGPVKASDIAQQKANQGVSGQPFGSQAAFEQLDMDDSFSQDPQFGTSFGTFGSEAYASQVGPNQRLDTQYDIRQGNMPYGQYEANRGQNISYGMGQSRYPMEDDVPFGVDQENAQGMPDMSYDVRQEDILYDQNVGQSTRRGRTQFNTYQENRPYGRTDQQFNIPQDMDTESFESTYDTKEQRSSTRQSRFTQRTPNQGVTQDVNRRVYVDQEPFDDVFYQSGGQMPRSDAQYYGGQMPRNDAQYQVPYSQGRFQGQDMPYQTTGGPQGQMPGQNVGQMPQAGQMPYTGQVPNQMDQTSGQMPNQATEGYSDQSRRSARQDVSQGESNERSYGEQQRTQGVYQSQRTDREYEIPNQRQFVDVEYRSNAPDIPGYQHTGRDPGVYMPIDPNQVTPPPHQAEVDPQSYVTSPAGGSQGPERPRAGYYTSGEHGVSMPREDGPDFVSPKNREEGRTFTSPERSRVREDEDPDVYTTKPKRTKESLSEKLKRMSRKAKGEKDLDDIAVSDREKGVFNDNRDE